MLITLLFILLVTIFCLRGRVENIICLLICILPFHGFISDLLTYYIGDPGLFPMWRDVCCLFLFVKVFLAKNKSSRSSILNAFIIMSMVYITFILMIFWGKYEKGISFYRIYMDALCIIYVLSQANLSSMAYRQIAKTFIFISLLACISGFVQYFILREYLHIIFDHYEITPMGTLAFKSPSWTIMGYERMAGFVGGPNNFGVYMSIVILVSFALKDEYGRILHRAESLLFTIVLLLSCFCLLLSFSRAGWGIVFVAFLLYQYRKYGMKKIIPIMISFVLFVGFVLILVYLAFPEASEIIEGTFSGQESSSASRASMVQDSYEILLGSLYGNGIGSADVETGRFFAESSMLNLTFELGIQGVILWYLILLIGLFICFRKHRFLPNVAYSLLIPSIIVSIASVNVMSWPFIYYLYGIIGLGVNISLIKQ